MLQSRLLAEAVQLTAGTHILVLNSAANPFVAQAAQQLAPGTITLAEDSVAVLEEVAFPFQHVPFHEYTLRRPPATIDVALLDLLYQPNNAWIQYALRLAAYALKPGGTLYVVGAKDRGIISVGKRVEEIFGNMETLSIQKGHRVLSAQKGAGTATITPSSLVDTLPTFAGSKLDEGTRLLIELLDVYATDEALDIGCGAGHLGLHIAKLATKGHVTMLDASLAAVAVARREAEQCGLNNVRVLPGNGGQPVLAERFDLVVTNPPFHQGGIQTTAIAERFICDAAQVLRPRGRFYLVANRFLKYEPTLQAHFKTVEEVGGNSRYKVLRAKR